MPVSMLAILSNIESSTSINTLFDLEFRTMLARKRNQVGNKTVCCVWTKAIKSCVACIVGIGTCVMDSLEKP
jgi:hypothetical protein